MSSTVLTFVIVGLDDHPIFEADLVMRGDVLSICADILNMWNRCAVHITILLYQSLMTPLLLLQARQDLEMTGHSTCINSSSTQPLMQ